MVRWMLRVTGVVIVSVMAGAGPTAQEYDMLGFPAPRGDAAAGRAAFLTLRCATCHQVTGETGLPTPTAVTRAPDLGPALVDASRSNLAGSIVVPGHRVSQALPPVERRQICASGGSPMGDYTDTMTIRQLVDLIAYLQSIVR